MVSFSSIRNLQLWFSRVSDATWETEQTIKDLFSATETERLNALHGNARRREYLLSRALMRHALSENFHHGIDYWAFVEQAETAPVIHNIPANVYLSLSHSDGFICFALYHGPIGVDLEAVDDHRDFLALADLFMNTEELACLRQHGAARAEYFYRAWCAKEACYKAMYSTRGAITNIGQISYSSLLEGGSEWNLIEGSSGRYRISLVAKLLPEAIRCESFLLSNKDEDLISQFGFIDP